jgi:hypothetical protein
MHFTMLIMFLVYKNYQLLKLISGDILQECVEDTKLVIALLKKRGDK